MIHATEDRMVGSAREVAAWLRARAEMGRERGDEPTFEAKVWRRGRSLDQNAYYWALLGKMGERLGYANDELHRHMLREYGTYDVFTVRADVPLSRYFRYYDVVGEGTADGVRYRHVRAFKGSSEMDRAEFSKLLDGAIQECQQLGIETMTPEEAARLRWLG